jgi:hypothetical protein
VRERSARCILVPVVLKISVMSSGAVLADGKPIELNRLEEKLKVLKRDGDAVWYYREPSDSAAILGTKIVEMVARRKLPISLSTRPDFADCARTDLEQVFANARATAAGAKGPCGLVIIRPDRRFLVTPALQPNPSLDTMAAGMERLIPSTVKRNIAVIADTSFAGDQAAPPSLAQANQSIPFFGLLTGLTYIGHYVWIFEGHESALAAACRDADVLIVDSGLLPSLCEGWADQAAAAMRNPNIIVHDRATFKLRFVRRAGESRDRLEFPN